MKLPLYKLRHGEACRRTITPQLESASEMKTQAKYFPVSVEAVYDMKSLDPGAVFQSLLKDISAAFEILSVRSFWMSSLPDLRNTKSPLDK